MSLRTCAISCFLERPRTGQDPASPDREDAKECDSALGRPRSRGGPYSALFNSGIKERCEFLENLAVAGIKIKLIELKSCEFRGKLTVAGIKVSGSKEIAQFSFRNLHCRN